MSGESPYPVCRDLSDIKPFCPEKGLYLKPLVKIKVSVQLPKIKAKRFTISNNKLTEAIKELALPDKFCCIKSTQASVDLVGIEAEVEVPKNVKWILSRIDGQPIELEGHSVCGKARATVAKNVFPNRHEWDTFFRDSKHMNEMKMGERPDTIHIRDIPKEWFVTSSSGGRPDERLLRQIFERFGDLSAFDIPSNDLYRSQMEDHISGLRQFNFRTTDLFEIYVQFKEYVAFVEAMDTLRGMKLLKKDGNKAWTQVIKVDFDKTKHLSESSIRKRKLAREKLMNEKRQEEENIQSKVTDEHSGKIDSSETADHSDVSLRKILREEKLFIAAQRKLESIRLLSVLLERIADKKNISSTSSEKPKKKQSIVINNSQPAAIENVVLSEDHDTQPPAYPIRNFDSDQRHSSSGKRFGITRRGRWHSMRGRNFNPERRWNNQPNHRRETYQSYSRRRNYFNHEREHRYHYDKTVHSLYYRYFESLARDKTEKTAPTSESDRSRSRSKSPSQSRSRRSEKSHSTSQRGSKSRERPSGSKQRRSSPYSRYRRRNKSRSQSSLSSRSHSQSPSRRRNRSKSRSYQRKEFNLQSLSHCTWSD